MRPCVLLRPKILAFYITPCRFLPMKNLGATLRRFTMRWHVQGTDAITGEAVELSVNEPQAEDAIRSAIKRRILVEAIQGERNYAWRRLMKPVAVVSFLALVMVCGGLILQNLEYRSNLDRLSQSMAHAEGDRKSVV